MRKKRALTFKLTKLVFASSLATMSVFIYSFMNIVPVVVSKTLICVYFNYIDIEGAKFEYLKQTHDKIMKHSILVSFLGDQVGVGVVLLKREILRGMY